VVHFAEPVVGFAVLVDVAVLVGSAAVVAGFAGLAVGFAVPLVDVVVLAAGFVAFAVRFAGSVAGFVVLVDVVETVGVGRGTRHDAAARCCVAPIVPVKCSFVPAAEDSTPDSQFAGAFY
jgi:hypothetical protein